MAFNRNQMAAAIAGTLSLAMLTGCPAPTASTPSPSASPAASEAPATAAPSEAPASPNASASPEAPGTEASATPAPPAPPASGKTVTVSGFVYNEKGATVNDATVTAKSTDGAYNFETKTVNGAYVFNNVPEGVVVEYTATKAGFTSRSQTETFQQATTGTKNEVNFGRSGGTGDAGKGGAYFISDFPEIAAATPADESTNVDGTALTYKLTLSEPLTSDGQDRLWDAFRIVPDNAIARSGDTSGTANNLENGENVAVNDGLSTAAIIPTSYGYEMKKNDSFLDSDTNLVRGSWNAEGTELTVTFNGALRTSDKEGGKYAALLLTDGRKIEDEQGNQLGTSLTSMTAYPAASSSSLAVLFNAFKANDLVVAATVTGDVGLENWARTHNSISDFQVAKDDKAPVLQSVRGNKRSDGNLRIELEFDEPMAAFGGNGAGLYGGNELFTLSNYTFAFGTESGKTSGTKLDGETAAQNIRASGTETVAGTTSATATTLPAEAEFAFTNTAASGIIVPSTMVAGYTALEVAGSNPKTVYFWIGKGNTLVSGLKEIKARVAGVKDPAGNVISASDADANVRTGSID